VGPATSFDKLQDVTLLCIICVEFYTVHTFECICKWLSWRGNLKVYAVQVQAIVSILATVHSQGLPSQYKLVWMSN